jgi:hypothetical protein
MAGMIKILDEQVGDAQQRLQDAKDQQEGRAPAGQPIPGTAGTATAAPKNQQITKQPNGDIKVQINQEIILPANILKDSVMQEATRQIGN